MTSVEEQDVHNENVEWQDEKDDSSTDVGGGADGAEEDWKSPSPVENFDDFLGKEDEEECAEEIDEVEIEAGDDDDELPEGRSSQFPSNSSRSRSTGAGSLRSSLSGDPDFVEVDKAQQEPLTDKNTEDEGPLLTPVLVGTEGQEQPPHEDFADGDEHEELVDNPEDKQKGDGSKAGGICGCICTCLTSAVASLCALGGCCLVILCLVVLAIIIIPIVLLVGLDIDGSNSSSNSDKSTSLPPLDLTLPSYTMAAIDASAQSPQGLSYEWMQKDPNLSDYDQPRQLQRFAMATIYNAFRGENWTSNSNWLSYEVSECEWGQPTATPFVQCGNNETILEALNDATETPSSNIFNQTKRRFLRRQLQEDSGDADDAWHVVALNMPKNNLVGSMPPELAYLTELMSVDWGQNGIFGGIPTQPLTALTQLINFNVSRNLVTGSIPSEIRNWTSLIQLSINNNQLTASLPTQLSTLPQLKTLDLSNNKLTGPLLTDMAVWGRYLEYMILHHNQFTGVLPSTIGTLLKLKQLQLDVNSFSGPIPTQVGNMKSLQILALASNDLTGPIPSEVGMLTDLEDLRLYDNDLSGSIPPQLGALFNYSLEHVILYDNNFTGVVDPGLCMVEELQVDCGPPEELCGCECSCEVITEGNNTMVGNNTNATVPPGGISETEAPTDSPENLIEPEEGEDSGSPTGTPGVTPAPTNETTGTVAPTSEATMGPSTNATTETAPPAAEETGAPTNATSNITMTVPANNTTQASTNTTTQAPANTNTTEAPLNVGNETEIETLTNATMAPTNGGISSGQGSSVDPSTNTTNTTSATR